MYILRLLDNVAAVCQDFIFFVYLLPLRSLLL